MMDSGIVNNHIFFTKPKKVYCSKPIRLFKKGLLSQAEDGVKMELVYKFFIRVDRMPGLSGVSYRSPDKKQIE